MNSKATAREALEALFGGTTVVQATPEVQPEYDGRVIANAAVDKSDAEGTSIIFLPRKAYNDLCDRANLDLKKYKGKTIFIISDEVE